MWIDFPVFSTKQQDPSMPIRADIRKYIVYAWELTLS